jgi:hypothetical protein
MRVRVMGPLLLAAAMLVSIGGFASSAGASGGGFNCSGSGGTMTASPGLELFSGKPQGLAWTQSGLSCTGGFVSAGNLKAGMQTPKAVRCSGIVGIVDRGTSTITWTAPAGMGKTTLKLNMTITSSVGHVTSGTLSGIVTTAGSNFASGKSVSGAFTLGKGLRSTQGGGDCTVNIPLTTFPITSFSLHT